MLAFLFITATAGESFYYRTASFPLNFRLDGVADTRARQTSIGVPLTTLPWHVSIEHDLEACFITRLPHVGLEACIAQLFEGEKPYPVPWYQGGKW